MVYQVCMEFILSSPIGFVFGSKREDISSIACNWIQSHIFVLSLRISPVLQFLYFDWVVLKIIFYNNIGFSEPSNLIGVTGRE